MNALDALLSVVMASKCNVPNTATVAAIVAIMATGEMCTCGSNGIPLRGGFRTSRVDHGPR